MAMTITMNDKHGNPVTRTEKEHSEYMRSHQMMWEDGIWAQRIPEDFRFEVGKRYPTLGGRIVTIIDKHDTPGYETVQGDDCGPDGLLGWRYNRRSDLGRATGSTWDADNNLIPFEIKE